MKRNPLSKRIPREMLKNCGKYLGIMCILIITIALGSSFQSTMDSTGAYLDKIKSENQQEDGFFELESPIKSDSLNYFAEKNIELQQTFYYTDNAFMGANKLLVFTAREKLNIPELFEGRLPENRGEILVDHCSAYHHDIKVGDTITVLGKELKVVGTCSFPDYTALFMNNTDMVMNYKNFGVSMVSADFFEELSGGAVTYRYSYRFDKRDYSKAELVSLSEDILKQLYANGESVQKLLRADQNQSLIFLETDMGSDGPAMTFFVYLLIAMIAFVFAVLINNTIDHESVIIGTLLASGYSKKEIVWHYLQPTLFISIAGSLIGNILGYTVMIKPFENIYYTCYSIGPLHTKFSFPAFCITTLLPIVIMIGINVFMLARKLSLSPLKFLRHDLKKGKSQRARKLPDFSFLNRFRLRVILQNKGSYIMLFLGIFFSSFMLMFGIGLEPLIDHYTESVSESLPYEYQYILKAPLETAGGEKLRFYEMDTWFALGNKDIAVSFMGIEKDSKIFKDAVPDKNIAISSAFAKKLGIKVGDVIKFKDSVKDKDYSLTVEKIVDYDAGLAVFMSRAELNSLLGDDENLFNSLLSTEKLDIDENYLAKQISRKDILSAADQLMDSFNTVIYFMNIFSVVVYLILIYILTKVVIEKNAINIAFMKVFGYEPGEIRKVYLTATGFVVVLSLLLCIPLEVGLFKLSLVYVSSMMDAYLPFYLPFYVYAEIVGIGLLAYFVLNALHIFTVNKIPMTDALKNRE